MIGRVSATGEVIPTDGRCRKGPDCVKKTRRRGSVPMTQIKHFCYGATWLLDKLAGNIPDVKTVNTLVKELDVLGYGKVKFVMDRGFCSKTNMDRLYQHHHKFIVAVNTGLSFVKKRMEEARESIGDYGNFDFRLGIGSSTQTMEWEYEQVRPYKKDVCVGTRRMYLQVYYSVQKAADEELERNAKLDNLRS